MSERDIAENVEILRNSVSAWNNMKYRMYQAAHIYKPQFCLKNADLSNFILSGADFCRDFLDGSNLSGCTLNNVDFQQANLMESNLSGTKLYKAIFRQTNLRNTSILNSEITNVCFESTELIHANFAGSIIKDSKFNLVDLSNADMSNAVLSNVSFTNVTFTETALFNASLTNVTFINCKFRLTLFNCMSINAEIDFQNCLFDNISCNYIYYNSVKIPKNRCFNNNEFETKLQEICNKHKLNYFNEAMLPYSPINIFMSYVKEDEQFIIKLKKSLSKQGFNIWLDKDNLIAGCDYHISIEKAIRGADIFIACFSNNYYNHTFRYMNEELQIAVEQLRKTQDNCIWFIPIRLTDCEIPTIKIRSGKSLDSLQYIDLYKNWSVGMRKIIESIKTKQLYHLNKVTPNSSTMQASKQASIG